MTLEQFIAQNREELDRLINGALNYVPKEASCYCPKSRTEHTHEDTPARDDEERRLWVLNNKKLYNWARSEGVREDEDED